MAVNNASNTSQSLQAPPSILVLTKNEEINIAACLKCLVFSDDIVVLDSYSTDRTVEIAKTFPNVRVIQRQFDTWSRHSNWVLENVRFKNPWVYYSDADEHVTPELRDEILRIINDHSLQNVAYRVRYKNMFMGMWLRYGGLYPVWIIRLFRPDCVRYEDREVNAHPIVNGTLGDLREHFIHYSFSKGLQPWFHKHNSYSEMESREAIRIRQQSFWGQVLGLFHQRKGVLRRSIKNLSFYLFFRAAMRFIYMLVFRLGFLDGRAGLHYAAMISMYEYWIEVKIREQEQGWGGRTKELAKFMQNESD